MNRPTLPPGIIPLGATHFYFDPARRTPVTNPWRRLDSDGTWHMLVGDQWNRIAASRRHMFVAVTDGVPAERVAHVELASESLTLRDYFAAKALQGMLACPRQMASDEHMVARDAYTLADAMLAARAKQ